MKNLPIVIKPGILIALTVLFVVMTFLPPSFFTREFDSLLTIAFIVLLTTVIILPFFSPRRLAIVIWIVVTLAIIIALVPVTSWGAEIDDTIIIWRVIPSDDGFIIEWETESPSSSQIEYGPTQALGSFTHIDPNMVLRHSVKVLEPMSQGTGYYFRAISKNAEGDSVVSDVDYCVFDRVMPTVTISSPQHNEVVRDVISVKVSATDDIGLEEIDIYIDHKKVATIESPPYEYMWNTVGYPEGKLKISIYANDIGGNSERATIDVIIDNLPPDTIPPTVNITYPHDGQIVCGKVTVKADVQDDQSRIRIVDFLIDGYVFGGALTEPYEATNRTDLYAPGEHTYKVRATDKAGNVGESEPITITIDVTPPVTTDDYQYNETWVNFDANITLIATDDLSGVAHTYYLLDGVQHEGTTITIIEEGKHTVYYWSIDNAGNAEHLHTIGIWIDKTPPEVAISADPPILWPPDHKPVQVTINGSATDGLSGIFSKVFTVTDEYNEVEATLSNFGEKIELIAWRTGDDKDGRTYTIKVVVTDKADNSTTQETVVTVPHDMRDKEKGKGEEK